MTFKKHPDKKINNKKNIYYIKIKMIFLYYISPG